MQPVAVRIIREEHTAIAAVLHGLEYVVDKIEQGAPPNFRLLHAMLEYIVEYPERCHHPKENRCLFKVLRSRNPGAARLIDDLEAEHVRADELLKVLSQTLAQYQSGGRVALRAFSQAVATYAEFHWQHMTKEEDVLIPIAKKSLTDTDWKGIAEAFLQNDNPLVGLKPKEHFAQLFDRILSLTSKQT
jgi:hemerythrin-like domain-containing protein